MKIHFPWFVGGPLLGLLVPLFLIFREKQLGVSSTFRFIGSFIAPSRSYFKYDRSQDAWQFQMVLGIILSAISLQYFDLIVEPEFVESKKYTAAAINIYSTDNWLLFLTGGVLIGFGARYAGGCTAGHAIMGNAMFSLGSLVSTICFFIGGLVTTHFLLPLIF